MADAEAPPVGGGAEGRAGTAAGGGATYDAAAGAGALEPPSTAARMSALLTRPPAPVPGTCATSMLFSRAILRTSGELRTLSPEAVTGAAGAGAAAGFCAGGGAAAAGFAASGGGAAGAAAAGFVGAGAAAAEPATSI